MSTSSDSPATIHNGPESLFVIEAVDAALVGDLAAAHESLLAAAAATSWSEVAHRLDVAGRALVDEVDVGGPEGVDWADAVALVSGEADPVVAVEAARVHAAWCDHHGISVTIDLTGDQVDVRSDFDRTWPALLVLTWLIDRAGYPAQVIA